jgi:hypothetical protein
MNRIVIRWHQREDSFFRYSYRNICVCIAFTGIPMMGFATSLEMKQFLGEDVSDDAANDETTSPNGIVVETLLNMGTVSALNMEQERYKNFQNAITATDLHYVRDGFVQGVLSGKLRSCEEL